MTCAPVIRAMRDTIRIGVVGTPKNGTRSSSSARGQSGRWRVAFANDGITPRMSIP
jgi:hypothetical protein